jgi:mRNA interferase MazF
VVLLNQIRSVDRRRLRRRLGSLKSETMREVDRALLLSLGLVEL